MQEQTQQGTCRGACACCSADRAIDSSGLAGWRLVLAATAGFLVPLVTAIAGAALLRHGKTVQVAGALGGFLVGLAAVLMVYRLAGKVR